MVQVTIVGPDWLIVARENYDELCDYVDIVFRSLTLEPLHVTGRSIFRGYGCS